MSTKTKTTKTKAKKENLAALGLPALWERFREATGRPPRARTKFLVRRIEEALARARRRARTRRRAAAPDAHQRARDVGAGRDDARREHAAEGRAVGSRR